MRCARGKEQLASIAYKPCKNSFYNHDGNSWQPRMN
jgi:hypothetical protein